MTDSDPWLAQSYYKSTTVFFDRDTLFLMLLEQKQRERLTLLRGDKNGAFKQETALYYSCYSYWSINQPVSVSGKSLGGLWNWEKQNEAFSPLLWIGVGLMREECLWIIVQNVCQKNVSIVFSNVFCLMLFFYSKMWRSLQTLKNSTSTLSCLLVPPMAMIKGTFLRPHSFNCISLPLYFLCLSINQ